ncbi:flagellar motor protein MotA [Methylocapsa sp. S129]|uniref:flagellar motor protein MotA n=1 Tax=Methylocapsa sp. S129 TaxID=1641869 RepID=UPI00131E0215|nr:flagellar motor protein MotA [Methylocapsa sp. S129]
MATNPEVKPLSSPNVFLVGMACFLILVGFVALILYKQIATAFSANPGLNGLIILVLVIGTVFAFRQIIRLFREIRWVNSLRNERVQPPRRGPRLLGPMATLINAGAGARGLSTATSRAILDSVGTRLDEGRELNRYLIGLLVFLGLLGTFWGLLETVHSISGVINAMTTGSDASTMFDDLKTGLSAPIAGMSISFTSSLFGLAGSLILGFLDLQAGQAQNRFYTELEDFLASHAEASPASAEILPEKAAGLDPLDQRKSAAALANLAEGIQGLVSHMRQEQQLIRDWVEAQASQQEEVRKLLERLAREHETR